MVVGVEDVSELPPPPFERSQDWRNLRSGQCLRVTESGPLLRRFTYHAISGRGGVSQVGFWTVDLDRC